MEKIQSYIEGVDWANVGMAAVIFVVGVIISYLLRAIVSGGINRTGIGRKAKTTGGNIGSSIGKAVFLVYNAFNSSKKFGLL